MRDEVKEILSMLDSKIYLISYEMESKKGYSLFIENIFDYLRAGFEEKELREAQVKYKFNPTSEVRTMQLRHFLTNIIFWSPLVPLDASAYLNEKYIVDTKGLSSKYISNYINENIIIPFRKRVSSRKLNVIIHDLIYELSRISADFNPILGITVNIESFIKVANENPRFDEIIHTQLDSSMQPKLVERVLNDLMEEEIEILKNTDNCLRPMLCSKTGIKEKTLAELSINIGLKPDLSGNTIPIPVNTNLITGGLKNITNYYIDAIAGRKALIANKTVMGSSGYFTKKTMKAVSGIKLRSDNEHCYSVNPLEIDIKTPEHLRRLVGRAFRTKDTVKYEIFTGKETKLIGSKVLIKSPITCSSQHGICEICYGPDLFHTNSNGVDVGAYAGALITNPVSQNVLSTKHLLTTISEWISFNEGFDTFFSLIANEITVNPKLDSGDYSLLIIHDNIVTMNELNEGEINEFVPIIHVRDNKTGQIMEFHEMKFKDLFISPDLRELIGLENSHKRVYEINFMDIPDDCTLFLLQIENNELTRPLYSIMALLDSKKKHEELDILTPSDMNQQLFDLLIDSNINVMAVHGEMLIRPLIRSKQDILARPDFNKYDAFGDSQLMSVTSALEKHPAPLMGISSSYLARQLKNPLTFKKRGSSFVDSLFRTHL